MNDTDSGEPLVEIYIYIYLYIPVYTISKKGYVCNEHRRLSNITFKHRSK